MSTPVVVLYHDVAAKTSAFEESIGVTTFPEQFSEHIKYFSRNYDFISLDDLLADDLPKRPLLLTFDDAYRSVLDIARQTLAPSGIPAILFTNPNLLAPSPPSLDNMLSWFTVRHGLPVLCEKMGFTQVSSLGELLQGRIALMGSEDRQLLRAKLMQEGAITCAELNDRSPILTAADVRELPTLGVEIGNHTASHVHCRSLSVYERKLELEQSRHKLEEISGRRVRSFSFPYGNLADMTPEVLCSLRSSGHQAIFLVHARSNAIRPAKDVWYRNSLHNEPSSKLRMELRIKPLLRTFNAMLRQ